jgi:hypothetical protein
MSYRDASYRERLSAPWWAFVAVPAAFAVVLTELGIGAPALASPVGYAVAVGLGLLVPLGLGRVVVAVRPEDGWLHVDDARLPGWAVGGVSVVDAGQRRRLLGLDSHPWAFVVVRPWIPGGVRVDLDDADDPTPYWFVSSRRPQELAAAVLALRERAGSPLSPGGAGGVSGG